MARVRLHTGNPPGAFIPPGGARDVRGSNPEFAKLRRPQRLPSCEWCGATAKVDASTPRRCKRCRKLEAVVASAASFMALHGLRALGGAVESDSDDELRLRQAARTAQRTLMTVKKAPRTQPVKPDTEKDTKLAKRKATLEHLEGVIAKESQPDFPVTPDSAGRLKRLVRQRDDLKRLIATAKQ